MRTNVAVVVAILVSGRVLAQGEAKPAPTPTAATAELKAPAAPLLVPVPANLGADAVLPPPEATPATAAPTLSCEKTGPATATVGRPWTYQIVLRNLGAVALQQVRVEDTLPADAHLVSTEPKGEQTGNCVSWNLGTLEPGGQRRLEVTLQPSHEGPLTQAATATFTISSTVSSSLSTNILPAPGRLALTLTGPERVATGGRATFRLIVANAGPGPLTGVVLRDRLPPGLQHPQGEFLEADVGKLAPAQSKQVTLEVAAVKPGRYVTQAIATSHEGGEASAQAVLLVTELPVVVRKSAPVRRLLTRESEYHIQATNPGPAVARHVELSDRLPDGFDFVSASDGGTFDAHARRVSWVLDMVPAGQTKTLTVRVLAPTAAPQ